MSKKVLILSSSPRRGGNSDTLCDEFLRGAQEAGHEVEKIFLKDKTIHYYTYSVTETEIKGYTTTIETSKDGFTFTIINRHFALLPDTGDRYLSTPLFAD